MAFCFTVHRTYVLICSHYDLLLRWLTISHLTFPCYVWTFLKVQPRMLGSNSDRYRWKVRIEPTGQGAQSPGRNRRKRLQSRRQHRDRREVSQTLFFVLETHNWFKSSDREAEEIDEARFAWSEPLEAAEEGDIWSICWIAPPKTRVSWWLACFAYEWISIRSDATDRQSNRVVMNARLANKNSISASFVASYVRTYYDM